MISFGWDGRLMRVMELDMIGVDFLGFVVFWLDGRDVDMLVSMN